jgi:toxin ParE1/3/4
LILRWLPRAIRDRDAQIDYIAERNPRAAIDQGDRIEEQVSQLLDHPEMGRPGRVDGTRELVISGTPFIVVYRFKPRAKRLELIRLLHGAQKWPPLDQPA